MRTIADILLDSIVVCQLRDQTLQTNRRSLQIISAEPTIRHHNHNFCRHHHHHPHLRHAARVVWFRERGPILFIVFWLGVIALAIVL